MEIMQIIGLGVIAAAAAVILKSQRPEMALQVSVIAGIIIIMLVAGKLSAVVSLLESYSRKANIDSTYLTTLLKIVGIAYITEFGADVSRDAGESAIASKIELAGKVIIIALAVPIITSLLDLIIRIMP